MKKTRVISILFVFGVFFWLLALTGEAATIWLLCHWHRAFRAVINDLLFQGIPFR